MKNNSENIKKYEENNVKELVENIKYGRNIYRLLLGEQELRETRNFIEHCS